MSSIIDPAWQKIGRREYRWVGKDRVQPEFGEVWYNEVSDFLFIRRVTHEAVFGTAQVRERVLSGSKRRFVIYIGDL